MNNNKFVRGIELIITPDVFDYDLKKYLNCDIVKNYIYALHISEPNCLGGYSVDHYH